MAKPFPVTITLHHADGGTTVQSHVRSRKESISRENFTSRSLGRMLRMVSDWQDDKGLALTGWTITEVDPDAVRNVFGQ